MRRFWIPLTAVCLLTASAATATRADDDVPTINLRTNNVKPGLKFRETTHTELKDADVTVKSDGKTLGTFKADILGDKEEEVTVKATEGRTVTEFVTRVVKEETTFRANGEDKEDLGALAGEVVLSKKEKSGWKHTLAEGTPTKEQKAELDDFSPVESGSAMPEGKQAIGASWDLDGIYFKKFMGSSVLRGVRQGEVYAHRAEAARGRVVRGGRNGRQVQGEDARRERRQAPHRRFEDHRNLLAEAFDRPGRQRRSRSED